MKLLDSVEIGTLSADGSWKTMPYGLLLSFGTTANLFYEKVFDFDAVFALDQGAETKNSIYIYMNSFPL